MNHPVLNEVLALRDAIVGLKSVRSVREQYKQALLLGFDLVELIYTYKIGEHYSSDDKDRFTQELRTLLETILNIESPQKETLNPSLKLLRWYARRTVRLLNEALGES